MNDQTKLELLKLSTQLTNTLLEKRATAITPNYVVESFRAINEEVFKSFNESKIIAE